MRFDLDLDAMLAKCERLQWSVTQVDWDAPGRDAVRPEQAHALAGFMADLYWIESIAAVVFRAMAGRTRAATLRSIFESFAIDEQRHADAELLLMRRWGISARNEVPAPNPNVRNLMRALERAADKVHPAVYSAIIPFTELVLDGALVKHLEVTVKDPVCAHVFRRINADEARHLAVDFYMLERFGGEDPRRTRRAAARALMHPVILYGLLLGYLPMLTRARPNLLRIGLGEDKVFACIRRYIALGDESPQAARHPAYASFRELSRRTVAGRSEPGEWLMRISDVFDSLNLRLAS
ncbi:MAG TPA: ferritin-like domain-containing protein [Polyangia bacterium]|nr:ferritin-like domain-containing protein [Polyangia bacterium]